MKTIYLTYYAYLREETGTSEETVQTFAKTAHELYVELQGRYKLKLPATSLKVSINDNFSSLKTSLVSGDHVVYLPPVAGGQILHNRTRCVTWK